MTPENYKKVINFLNTTTNKELVYLLQCIGDKIVISTHKGNKINHYKIYEPHSNIYLNETHISLNVDLNK